MTPSLTAPEGVSILCTVTVVCPFNYSYLYSSGKCYGLCMTPSFTDGEGVNVMWTATVPTFTARLLLFFIAGDGVPVLRIIHVSF